ncbi:MAG: RluA family pseudouridine synthase [Clostridiales bacterium]|nr:RluA family pseudouridine synthase [Clostridiales bacterium]
MNEALRLTVSEEAAGIRIDRYISESMGSISRSRTAALIDENAVSVNGAPVPKSYKLKAGDEIEIIVSPPREICAKPQNIELDIVWEDSDLLVVNKAKGMVVHPAPGNYDGTLVNALLYRYKGQLSGINGALRPGIVHRIDKDTSGLLVVAKTDMAHESLARQVSEHSFERAYECVVHGVLKENSGTVRAPIGRDAKDRKKMAVTYKNSKPAVTHYALIKQFKKYAHMRCVLETGRTHQIRVHMAYISHPVAGDLVYGPKNTPKELRGQCLHAKHIGFLHPRTGELLEFESALPDYFTAFLSKLEKEDSELGKNI